MATSEFQSFDSSGEFRSYERHLPHWRQPGATYFVTFRLGDALPHQKLQAWGEERRLWLQARGLGSEAELEALSPSEKALYQEYFGERLNEWLDQGSGSCVLRNPLSAQIVAEALLHFDQQRYVLDAFVIMPNHVHALVKPLPGHSLANVSHSWKGFTARKINETLGKTGPLWQAESYDRLVRDAQELERWREYIRLNPVRASMPEGEFILGAGVGVSVAGVKEAELRAGKPGATLQPAVFLDRDGTLMHDTGYVSKPSDVQVYPGVPEALAALKQRGFRTVIVTNQSGIGRGYFTEADFDAVQARFLELIGPGLIDATYMCAEHPDTASERRKPGPGMLLEAAHGLGIDLARSWMIGDRAGDIEAGRRAGTRTILVQTGEGAAASETGADSVAKDFAAAARFILTAG